MKEIWEREGEGRICIKKFASVAFFVFQERMVHAEVAKDPQGAQSFLCPHYFHRMSSPLIYSGDIKYGAIIPLYSGTGVHLYVA